MRLAAALCAGVPPRSARVARVRSAKDLWSARVGIHHRLLFRIHADRRELEIVDLIHRRRLDTVLKGTWSSR